MVFLFLKCFIIFLFYNTQLAADINTMKGDYLVSGNLSVLASKALKTNTILQTDTQEDLTLDLKNNAFIIRQISRDSKVPLLSIDSNSIKAYKGLSGLSLITTASVLIGTDLTVCGSLTVKGAVTTINSVSVTYSSIVGNDLTVGDSTTLYGDVRIGNPSKAYGSLTVSSSALLRNALTVTGSSVFMAPVTLVSSTVTGSEFIGSDLTTSGSITIGQESNSKSLLVTGTIIQGTKNAYKILGQGALSTIITGSASTKICTLNYTSTAAGSWMNLYFFGNSSGGELEYRGTYFITPKSGRSSMSLEETYVTDGGDIILGASFTESSTSVDLAIKIKTPSSGNVTIDSGYFFYEVMGKNLVSVTL